MDTSLFRSASSRGTPTNTVNRAGGKAYALSSEEALAQVAATGCFGGTYYADAKEQIEDIVKHAEQARPEFLAKLAIYARQRGHMKDMPAVLLAILATRDPQLMERVFPAVIDNGRMLRNFVQAVRSGQFGRKSLGTVPKRAVQKWLQGRTPFQLFRDSIGNSPSLVDVIKMVHVRPVSPEQSSMIHYLLSKDPAEIHENLPAEVLEYELFKRGDTVRVPKVPSRFLQGLELTEDHWKSIAYNARWQETRMNLNSFDRHGVFNDAKLTRMIADRLADPNEVRKAKAFPYQLFTAYKQTSGVPTKVRNSLQDAMEVAIENVPEFAGVTVACPDVSSSMRQSVTGYRYGATSATRCVDVAALVAATVLRKSEDGRVIPFDTRPYTPDLNPRDTVVTLAEQLARYGGGGTACSEPLKLLNQERAKADTVIFISDNESWADGYYGWYTGTPMMEEWDRFKKRNPNAKLVLIDLVPNTHSQVTDRPDVLRVGGFSDAVFDVINGFLRGDGKWLSEVKAIDLP